jgi:putative endonuclease
MICTDDGDPVSAEKSWFVYILSCRDRTLYTGITRDPRRRLLEHNSTPDGARYTRGRRPVVLVYLEPHPSRSAASRREHAIKRMSVARKNHLIGTRTVRELADISP